MARRLIFAVNSPLGYRVSLTRDRWREIVKFKHPALAGNEHSVRQCFEAPMLIRESAKNPDVHIYYAPFGQAYICVVVAPETQNERFVVTAYFASNIKKGNELWRN